MVIEKQSEKLLSLSLCISSKLLKKARPTLPSPTAKEKVQVLSCGRQ
jgi:hypothetical protein